MNFMMDFLTKLVVLFVEEKVKISLSDVTSHVTQGRDGQVSGRQAGTVRKTKISITVEEKEIFSFLESDLS